MNLFIQKSLNAKVKNAIFRISAMTRYTNDSFPQSVFLNLLCHFNCILDFPHPAVLLYLSVAIKTRWIKGLYRDRICLGEKTRISQKRISGICSNIP